MLRKKQSKHTGYAGRIKLQRQALVSGKHTDKKTQGYTDSVYKVNKGIRTKDKGPKKMRTPITEYTTYKAMRTRSIHDRKAINVNKAHNSRIILGDAGLKGRVNINDLLGEDKARLLPENFNPMKDSDTEVLRAMRSSKNHAGVYWGGLNKLDRLKKHGKGLMD